MWEYSAEAERVAYRRVVETSSAVVARESGAVDDLVFAVGACEARLTVALVAADTDVVTDTSAETRIVRRAVIQVYTATQRIQKLSHARDHIQPKCIEVEASRITVNYSYFGCVLSKLVNCQLQFAILYSHKKLSSRRETVRCFVSLNIRSLEVIQSDTMRKLGYGFLFTLHSNYGSILYHFRDKVRYWLKTRFFIITACIQRPIRGSLSAF